MPGNRRQQSDNREERAAKKKKQSAERAARHAADAARAEQISVDDIKSLSLICLLSIDRIAALIETIYVSLDADGRSIEVWADSDDVEDIRSGDPETLLELVERTEDLQNYADMKVLDAICKRLIRLSAEQFRARAETAEERAETAEERAEAERAGRETAEERAEAAEERAEAERAGRKQLERSLDILVALQNLAEAPEVEKEKAYKAAKKLLDKENKDLDEEVDDDAMYCRRMYDEKAESDQQVLGNPHISRLSKCLDKALFLELTDTGPGTSSSAVRGTSLPPQSLREWSIDAFQSEIVGPMYQNLPIESTRTFDIVFESKTTPFNRRSNESDAFLQGISTGIIAPFFSTVFRGDTFPGGGNIVQFPTTEVITALNSRPDLTWRASKVDSQTVDIFLVHEQKAPSDFPVDASHQQDNWFDLFKAAGPLASVEQNINMNMMGAGKPRLGIYQVYSYMVILGLEFGVLSTTRFTWFLKRDNEGTLWITKGFSCMEEGRTSLRNAYFCLLCYILHSPRRGQLENPTGKLAVNVKNHWSEQISQLPEDCTRPGASVLRGLENSSSGSQGSSSVQSTMPSQTDNAKMTADSSANASGFQSERQAGLRWGSTFEMPLPWEPSYVTLCTTHSAHIARMTLNNGKGPDAVVKTLSYPKRREEADAIESTFVNEIQMYCGPLQKLQGTVVPRFIFGGIYSKMERFLVVTEYGGDTLLKLSQQQVLTTRIQRCAHEALMAVHRAGVLHNDVALHNFLWNGESVVVIDFGRSYVCTDLEQFAREADDLEMLLSQHESMS